MVNKVKIGKEGKEIKQALRGSFVAIVTPFERDNVRKVDFKSLETLVEFHSRNGTAGIVPCGTTGESATLTHEEHEEVIKKTVEFVNHRTLVIAGTGSNNTAEAIRLTKSAELAGADASLLICPYYNKPTQDGLYLHFKAISEESGLPLIPYNIASRTGVNIEPETVARLAELPTIVGIKEASGNLDQMSRIISLCGDEFALLSGDDSLTLPILAIGGTGVISVVANIMPEDTARMVSAFEKGAMEEARRIHYKLLPLIKMLFIETNPTPIKTAMEMLNMCSSEVRLPLVPMKEQNKTKLAELLKTEFVSDMELITKKINEIENKG